MTARIGSSPFLLASGVALAAVTLGGFGAATSNRPHHPGSSDWLTFNKHIAPILFEHCASCHRPGGGGPFDLLTYRDVQLRLPLIADAIERRAMPPWVPEPGFAKFVGERRLSDEEIDIFRRWVDEGAIEGNPADLPPAPQWSAGWQLGEPDLVVTLPPYTVPATGREIYRNLVAPIPVSETRYVTSVELWWGDTRVVHHARMMIDSTPSSRLFDERSPEPGFDGMDIVSDADNPPGHFVGWAPGRVQVRGADEIAWPLNPGTDLVLQLHLRPTGLPELVEAKIGFIFAERPPTKAAALIMLGSFELDIPPGEANYLVTDTYELPVDVDALGVYPHAHYLGKQVWGVATLPDGTTKWLLRVDKWNFDSQDMYRYETPIFLPAGTTLSMRWVYDNSADNPLNPNDPPERVVYGSRSSDEMSDLVIQVVPRNRSELEILKRDLAWKYERRDVIYLARREHAMGDSLAAQRNYAEAIPHYQQALRLKTDDADVHVSMAKAFASLGQHSVAVTIAERAAQLTEHADPGVLEALAAVYAAAGQTDRAVRTAERALQLATQMGADDLARTVREHLRLYRQNRK